MALKSPHMLAPDAPFRLYNKTKEQAWREGYDTGLTWTHSHTPGGPRVERAGRINDPDWIKYCIATTINAAAWMDGFHDGKTDRLVAGTLLNMGLVVEKQATALRLREGTWHASLQDFYRDESKIYTAWEWCYDNTIGEWLFDDQFYFAEITDAALFDLAH